MSRGKHFLNSKSDEFTRIEKIKKQNRSSKGRTVDDWLIDSKENKKAKHADFLSLEECLASGMRVGRVIEVQKRHVFVAEENKGNLIETDLLWFCSIAKRHFQRVHKERNFVVVGDRVLFSPDAEVPLDDHGDPIDSDLPRGTVHHGFMRTSKISRKDPMNPEWEHVMLANIDLCVIVASVLNPEVRFGLIDRFIVQAEMENIDVAIVLNKSDLLKDKNIATPEFLAKYQKRVEIYKNIGYQVFEVSSLYPEKTKADFTRLRKALKGKIVGFAGHSGVGKSSIINLMKPEFEQVVDEDPDIFYKGRHTTTYNSLLRLGIGAYAIDTPGIRSFDIDSFEARTLSHCFREFRAYSCLFRECAHDLEQNCAIKEAVKKGEISLERYHSYIGILKGVSFREGSAFRSDAELIADLKARLDYKE